MLNKSFAELKKLFGLDIIVQAHNLYLQGIKHAAKNLTSCRNGINFLIPSHQIFKKSSSSYQYL